MTIPDLSHRACPGSNARCEGHARNAQRGRVRTFRAVVTLLGVQSCLGFFACGDRRIVFCDPDLPVMDGNCGVGGAAAGQGGSGGRGGAAGQGGAAGTLISGGTGGLGGGAGSGGISGTGGTAVDPPVTDAGVDATLAVDAG